MGILICGSHTRGFIAPELTISYGSANVISRYWLIRNISACCLCLLQRTWCTKRCMGSFRLMSLWTYMCHKCLITTFVGSLQNIWVGVYNVVVYTNIGRYSKYQYLQTPPKLCGLQMFKWHFSSNKGLYSFSTALCLLRKIMKYVWKLQNSYMDLVVRDFLNCVFQGGNLSF